MADQNSDLKTLIRESKASLFELEEMLQKAETLLEKNTDPRIPEKEEWAECAAALAKIVENIQEKLSRQSPESSGREVLAIHQQIAEQVPGGRVGVPLQQFGELVGAGDDPTAHVEFE